MKPLYILHNDQQLGPFQPEDVQHLLNTGQLNPDDPAWTEGRTDWDPLQQVLQTALTGDPATREPTLRPRIQTEEAEEKKPRPFLFELPYAFIYPLRGSGSFRLIGATIALIFAGVLFFTGTPGYNQSRHAFGGALLITGSVLFYYSAFVLQVIRATASGDDAIPEATDIASLHDEMSGPLIQILGTVLGCLAPAGYAWYLIYRDVMETEWLVVVLLAASLAYLPMGLLATTILGTVTAGLAPWVVIPTILRSFSRYLVILFVLSGTVVGNVWLFHWLHQHLILLAAGAVVVPVVLYLSIVQARLLGLIFKTSPNRLGWFG